ncbi:hypothetical protein QQX98_008597 [Neonectria punicea]|uniref:ATPase AAA-type core domain-containing protein n=1 Tax=Neonectria punicea TaxID=979145 RepID=A0ABR1GUP4_9HYPO
MTENTPGALSTPASNETTPTSSIVPAVSGQSSDAALDTATDSITTNTETSVTEDSSVEKSTSVKASAEPSESDLDGTDKQSNKTPPADEGEGKDETTSVKIWAPSAPLYCRVNGQSHASLTTLVSNSQNEGSPTHQGDLGNKGNIGIKGNLGEESSTPPQETTPASGSGASGISSPTFLSPSTSRHASSPMMAPPGMPPPPRPYPSNSYPPYPYMNAPGNPNSDDSDSQYDTESSDKGSPDEEKPADQVSYSIEYRDSGNYYLTRQSWEGPFDLASAREGLHPSDRPVFEVVTILDTSITASQHRSEPEVRNIMFQGILTNPNVTVKIRTTRLIIYSIELIKIIRSAVNYYPANLQADTLELKAPYMLIGHHLDELEAYLASHSDTNALESVQPPQGITEKGEDPRSDEKPIRDVGTVHLGMLLDFYKGTPRKAMTEERSRHARERCAFNMLWLLFRPGITVYYDIDGQLRAFVVNKFDTSPEIFSMTENTRVKQRKEYTVNMWNLAYNGRFVGRVSDEVYLPHFDGERQISSLRLVPCEFIDNEDGGKTGTRLEDEGKKWYDLLRGGQVHYSGRLLDAGGTQFRGRAYVDMASFFAQDPDMVPDICEISDMGDQFAKCQCDECLGFRPHPPTGFRWAHYDLLNPHDEKDLEMSGAADGPRHRYLLCGRSLYGFDLKSRTWIMPTNRKEMIKALINKFTDSDSATGSACSWRADFLENKGEGQVFLLHGSLGVGKTYTAGKLISLCGAVMLIDEADVFLEKRQVTDLKHNSLVSVFLRCIEYYRGVLFLTTNRVGHFDDAFMSRIHVIIFYDKLGLEERKQIWEQFFDKLSDEREDFVIAGRARAYVLEDETISFQTAVALAEFRFLQKPNKMKHDYLVLDQKDFE